MFAKDAFKIVQFENHIIFNGVIFSYVPSLSNFHVTYSKQSLYIKTKDLKSIVPKKQTFSWINFPTSHKFPQLMRITDQFLSIYTTFLKRLIHN